MSSSVTSDDTDETMFAAEPAMQRYPPYLQGESGALAKIPVKSNAILDSQLALAVASSPHPDDFIHTLPLDAKYEVIKFLRSTIDLKHLALVNNEWKKVVLPFLWNTLTTDLVPTERKELVDLVHPDSNVLKNVQHIKIRQSENAEMDGDNLHLLFLALSKGQLKAFESEVPLPFLTFQTLIRMHQQLHTLRVVAGDDSWNTLLTKMARSSWGLNCFSSLIDLTVFVDREDPSAIRMLLEQYPALISLSLEAGVKGDEIVDWSRVASQSFVVKEENETRVQRIRKLISRRAEEKVTAIQLRKLQFRKIKLPKSLRSMFQRIDVQALQELVLRRCPSTARLLNHLTSKYKNTTLGLKTLRIQEALVDDSGTFVQDVECFLASFTGLEELRIEHKSARPVSVDSIATHGSTLRVLSVVVDDHQVPSASHYTAVQVIQLSVACPLLTQLCLNIYELCANSITEIISSARPGPPPHVYHLPTDFQRALGAIASLQFLHTLRLANHTLYYNAASSHPPSASNSFNLLEAGLARQFMHERVTGLFQYLCERGSRVKVLAFSPIGKVESGLPDENGHIFPDYYYFRGRMTDGMGTDMAVARPLKEWAKDFPGSTILGEG